MFSLILACFGTIIALGGALLAADELRQGPLTRSSLGAWVLRAGLLVMVAAEVLAVFRRPELGFTYKVMLLGAGAVVFLGLALFSREWRQPGFTFKSSFSWQVIAAGSGAYLGAVMFIQPWLMLAGVVLGWLAIRASRSWLQSRTDSADVTRAIGRFYIGLALATLVLLFL